LGASAIAAGFQSLVSRAAVSLANNKGDLGKVLKELGSSASIKSLATSMVTAGLVSAMPVDLIPAASASPLWLSSNFTQQLQVNLVRGAMSAGVTVGSTTELTVLSTFRDQAGREF
jgi:filamentous hemagglutinin